MNNSPAKLEHFLPQQSTQQFTSHYFAHSLHQDSIELGREHLQNQAHSIQSTLASLFPDRPKLGSLFSTDPSEAQKTLEVIKLLLCQRQRDIQGKNQIYSNLRRVEGQRAQLSAHVEKLQREMKRVETDRDNLLVKVKGLQKSHKETVQKLVGEREDWMKRFRAIEARENQYINSSRKQEQTIKHLQDKVGRGQEKGPFKNTFQVMQQLQTYGPTFVMVNADHQYNQMVAKTMEENYVQITAENQFYKDTLQNIQKQLQHVLDLKCEIMKRRRGADSDFDSAFEIAPLRPELLNLPQTFTRHPVSVLQENVSRFKEAMRAGQAVDEREADQKVTCVSSVKHLIRNYKNVVESQEQLLNRVILKAKEFKSTEMRVIESRNSHTLSQQQIDRARNFIEEQGSYLQAKNRELQLTRKAMQGTMRKAQEEREQFVRRTGKAGDELQQVKRQIEQLPTLVDQQLSGI